MTRTCDVLVIGGGVAGTSVAAALATDRTVIVAERESAAGYHSTGRSAALFFQNYGPPGIRFLTAASRPFYEDQPDGFADAPLMTPRGVLMVADRDGVEALERELGGGHGLEPLAPEDALARVPILRKEKVAAAAFEPDARDLDVAAIHQGYIRSLKRAGGEIALNAEVSAIARAGSTWRVETRSGAFETPVLIDAAGAWADEIAALAGVRPVGLTPKRRTGVIVPLPEGTQSARWPLVSNVPEAVYFKPEAGGKLMLSPADATPVPPCDVQPEDLDVAIAVDQLERLTSLEIRRVEHRWAGLRTFAPDGEMVIGWAPDAEGFFWLAGQGGYGIQTAPGASALASALIRGAMGDGEDQARARAAPERFA